MIKRVYEDEELIRRRFLAWISKPNLKVSTEHDVFYANRVSLRQVHID